MVARKLWDIAPSPRINLKFELYKTSTVCLIVNFNMGIYLRAVNHDVFVRHNSDNTLNKTSRDLAVSRSKLT